MRVFLDYGERQVILTDAAEQHISSGHQEIGVLGPSRIIGETLASPDVVVNYSGALHYSRMWTGTPFGDKYVRVVVAEDGEARYVRTAYLTGRVVKGAVVWERET